MHVGVRGWLHRAQPAPAGRGRPQVGMRGAGDVVGVGSVHGLIHYNQGSEVSLSASVDIWRVSVTVPKNPV